jgi:hypothetical protein
MSPKKPTKKQLYFDFARDEKNIVRRPRNKQKDIALLTENTVPPAECSSDFRDLCVLLHGLAKKHVAVTNFHDFNLVARCTKLLQNLGVSVSAPSEMQATVASQEVALVTSAPEYRLLRSRAMAGLATVADLADRLPAKGSHEYQRGMCDAYEQASTIAILFLEDLEKFETRGK